MDCKHERLRCTNNQFFCLACGKMLRYPSKEEIFKGGKEVTLPPIRVAKPPEREKKPEKKPVKRTAKKEEKNANG